MMYRRSDDNWAEYYNCPKCELSIRISFGETMHAAPDVEKWTRKQSLPVPKPNDSNTVNL